MRAAWHMALKPRVSEVSTDAELFSEQGVQLDHHYRVFGDCAAHGSLRGSFVVDLLYFTNRSHWVAKRSRCSGAGSPDQLVLLCWIMGGGGGGPIYYNGQHIRRHDNSVETPATPQPPDPQPL